MADFTARSKSTNKVHLHSRKDLRRSTSSRSIFLITIVLLSVPILVLTLKSFCSLIDENQFSSIKSIYYEGMHVDPSNFSPAIKTVDASVDYESHHGRIDNIVGNMHAHSINPSLPAMPTMKHSGDNQCPLRALGKYERVEPPNMGEGNEAWRKCLKFECEWKNIERCDNMEPTNYDGPEPPCCVHVLRDLAKAFDDVMCKLGLEYFSSYGTLLGLVRSDRLIPWTADNDYIVTRPTISAMINQSPEDEAVFQQHGIFFFFQLFFRICVTPDFAEGKLAANWQSNKTSGNYDDNYPFSDIFFADEIDGQMVDQRGCSFPMEAFRPAVRKAVYNNSFHVSVPNDPEQVVEGIFGKSWRTPDNKNKFHGSTKCRWWYIDRKW